MYCLNLSAERKNLSCFLCCPSVLYELHITFLSLLAGLLEDFPSKGVQVPCGSDERKAGAVFLLRVIDEAGALFRDAMRAMAVKLTRGGDVGDDAERESFLRLRLRKEAEKTRHALLDEHTQVGGDVVAFLLKVVADEGVVVVAQQRHVNLVLHLVGHDKIQRGVLKDGKVELELLQSALADGGEAAMPEYYPVDELHVRLAARARLGLVAYTAAAGDVLPYGMDVAAVLP